MRLRDMREHYQRKGNTWFPKTPYDTEQEVRDADFAAHKWYVYPCGECGKLHKARIGHRRMKNVS